MSHSQINGKRFFNNILNAVGAGVVIALLPNALLGELLKFFKEGNHVLETIFQLVTIIQSFMAFIIGVLAAHQFKFKGTGAAIIGISAMLGSGAVHYNGQTIELKGIGDIINVILVVILACFIYMFLEGKLGSLEMIILPVLVPVISGLIGLLTLPYVQVITQSLGKLVNRFTELNPLLMSILICVTFLFGSLRVNSLGVNVVLLIGAAKMMIPVYLKHLIIAIPLTINGVICGIIAYILKIKGTALSAGFGYTGLVGPINALNRMSGNPSMNIILLIIGYFVIPFAGAFIVHKICKKVLSTYSDEIYKFEISKD